MKRLIPEKFGKKPGIACIIKAAIWLLSYYLNKWIKKQIFKIFLWKPFQKKELSRNSDQKGKESPYLDLWRDND